MKKIADWLLLAAVVVILALPLLSFNLEKDQISVVENRSLAELASVKEGLNPFMESVGNYVDDRIGYRDQMMRWYNDLNYVTLKGNHSKVLVGEDGWLFYRSDLDDYVGANVDPAKTERQVQILEAIDSWCQARDIKFVLAIGPNKSTVYSQYMPDSIRQAEVTNVDYAVSRLEEAGICVCYPKEEMIADRNTKDLYLRLDTHWNAYGAQYLLNDMLEAMDIPQKEYTFTESEVAYGDLQNMLGISSVAALSLNVGVEESPQTQAEVLNGGREIYFSSENTDKIVCYRDSCHIAMTSYYTHYFNGSILWNYYDINFDYVEAEKPKYLILSCMERYFDDAVEANAEALSLNG